MDSLAPLNSFIRAAENESFTVAGRELGISASAVGKAVTRLEQRIGVRLLHRSTRKITLTAEGELFLKRCRRIFSELESAEQEIAQSHEPRGKLRVSLPLISSLIIAPVSAFAAAHPSVELDLESSDRLVDAMEEGFDVVVRMGPANDSGPMIRHLGAFSYAIVGAPKYFAARGIPGAPEDLADHDCLYHRWSSTGKLERWQLSRDGADLDFQPVPMAVANTMEPLIAMAEQGLGLVYTPMFDVQKQIAAGTLQSVLNGNLRSTSSIQLLWPPGHHTSPKVRAFVEFMTKNLASI
ncbi:DNA-binding transcriptional LysR family regulator [Nitrobacteraceae bacterium AZCC 2161]